MARSRRAELGTVLRVNRDMVRGLRRLHFVGPSVTVFGSARTPEDSPDYALAREMADRRPDRPPVGGRPECELFGGEGGDRVAEAP